MPCSSPIQILASLPSNLGSSGATISIVASYFNPASYISVAFGLSSNGTFHYCLMCLDKLFKVGSTIVSSRGFKFQTGPSKMQMLVKSKQ